MSTGVVLHDGTGIDRARSWVSMPDDERRRRAGAACQAHDQAALAGLADAYLTLHGKAGARVSQHTRDNYRRGIGALLTAWREENLLRPRRDVGALWLREMEAAGLKASTIGVRLAAARCLYAALRWAGATELDPLRDARPAADTVEPWEKRQPYSEDDVRKLILLSSGDDQALVLLGAHAGLRVSEMLALRWDDIDLTHRQLVVRKGKGGKPRTVAMSRSLAVTITQLALHGERVVGNEAGYVLPYRSTVAAWKRLNKVCVRAGVAPRGIHSLRHAAGTRVVQETGSLEEAARHLGHASIETTRVYAKWSNKKLKATVGEW
jgi:integrase